MRWKGGGMDVSRRAFVHAAALAAAGLAVGSAAPALAGCASAPSARLACMADDGPALLRPPGMQSQADLNARCIGCAKCVEACPYRAIRLAGHEFGLQAATPYIDARERACRLCEDVPCAAACPTGALRDVAQRADVAMGVAVVDEGVCVSALGMRCEVCYRACPLIDEAITIDYRVREGDAVHAVFMPQVHEDACTGCGLCVERCVVGDPHPAIRIRAAS